MEMKKSFFTLLVMGVFVANNSCVALVTTIVNASDKPVIFFPVGENEVSKLITIKKKSLEIVTLDANAETYNLEGNAYQTKDINWQTLTVKPDGSVVQTNPLYEFVCAIENCSTDKALVLYEQKNKDRIAKWTVDKGLTQVIKIVGGLESSYYVEELEGERPKRSSTYTLFGLKDKKVSFHNNKFDSLVDLVIDFTVTVQNDTKNIMHFRPQRTSINIATIAPGQSKEVVFRSRASNLFNLNPEDSANPGKGDMPSKAYTPRELDSKIFKANKDGSFSLGQ